METHTVCSTNKMQLSVVRITLASLLFSSVWAAAANNDSTPGGRLKTLLKPPINSQTGIWGEERRESVLRGLLQVRQSFCPAGYGKCTSSSRKCCPLNGGCCPNGQSCSLYSQISALSTISSFQTYVVAMVKPAAEASNFLLLHQAKSC